MNYKKLEGFPLILREVLMYILVSLLKHQKTSNFAEPVFKDEANYHFKCKLLRPLEPDYVWHKIIS